MGGLSTQVMKNLVAVEKLPLRAKQPKIGGMQNVLEFENIT
jgi:hypothetical protein